MRLRNFSQTSVDAHLHPVVCLGQVHHGMDFGCKTTVLIDCGDRFLWWQHPGHVWRNRMDGYVHTQSALYLISTSGPNNFADNRVELVRGGRLSRRIICEHRTTINNFFGIDRLAEVLKENLTRPVKTTIMFAEKR